MKQHPAFSPFARDHCHGEHEAQALKDAAFTSVQVVQRLAVMWKEKIEPHFSEEERILNQYIIDKTLWNKLLEDHRLISSQIKRLIASDEIQCSLMLQLGEMMENHYLWEEQVLFPTMARTLDNSSKIRHMHETHIWEAIRSRNYIASN